MKTMDTMAIYGGMSGRLRKNWLLAGSQRACKRVAATVTLIQSARLNGHEPFAYLNDLLNVSVLSTPS